jgi:hypothetical protein
MFLFHIRKDENKQKCDVFYDALSFIDFDREGKNIGTKYFYVKT